MRGESAVLPLQALAAARSAVVAAAADVVVEAAVAGLACSEGPI